VYAYLIDAVEKDIGTAGGSIIEAREKFDAALVPAAADSSTEEPVSKRREQAKAQRDLMAAMAKGSRA
jgi:hypothetical protein